MTRRQLRRAIRWEVIIAIFGAILGLTLGVIFGGCGRRHSRHSSTRCRSPTAWSPIW